MTSGLPKPYACAQKSSEGHKTFELSADVPHDLHYLHHWFYLRYWLYLHYLHHLHYLHYLHYLCAASQPYATTALPPLQLVTFLQGR